MKTLLRTLTDISAPSGKEDELRALVRNLIQPHADEIRVDALGNLIARKGRKSTKGKRVMLAAHLDEIGLIVSHVDANGFARFNTLGGFVPHRRVGTRVRFTNGARGVIGLERNADAKDRAPSLDKYFIDTGATSPKDSPVKVGDAATYDPAFHENGERVLAKSLDNRVGVALLIEFLQNLKTSPHEIYCVFTVQEEMGARGAGPAAYGLSPDIGLAIDTMPTSDTPHASERNPVALGKGPAIKIKEANLVSDPALVDLLTRLAQKNRIPHQFEIADSGGTDARVIQLTGLGARAGGITVPLRYLHSPSEMIDLRDVKNASRLLTALLRSNEL
jgi:endoglucanase